MNIEEKARAYDEALKKARKELNTCGSLDCDAARQIFRFFPELRESEDERIRKKLIGIFTNQSLCDVYNLKSEDVLAYLEKQKEPCCTEEVQKWKKELDSLCKEHYGQKSSVWDNPIMTNEMLMEKQKEQKPVEWSKEDEKMLNLAIEWAETMSGQFSFVDMDSTDFRKIASWLKSLRPQPREEIYHAAKHDLAIRFMNYLDENRPDGKMGLSSGECENIDKAFKENDWEKILRYAEKYGK